VVGQERAGLERIVIALPPHPGDGGGGMGGPRGNATSKQGGTARKQCASAEIQTSIEIGPVLHDPTSHGSCYSFLPSISTSAGAPPRGAAGRSSSLVHASSRAATAFFSPFG